MRSIKYGTLAEWVTALAAVLRTGGRPLRPRGCRPVPWWSLVALMLSAATGAPLLAAERVPVKSLLEMRQNRAVVQKWDLSCGAASLATLLTYQHGDPVSERAIAMALIQRQEYLANPSLVRVREGFSLLDLKRYVDKRDYTKMTVIKATNHR